MLPSFATLLTAVAALAVVLALVWLAARGARMAGLGARAGNGRMLRAVDSLALDPRRRLHLVACGQSHVLLLTGGGADLVVGWMPDMPARSGVGAEAGGDPPPPDGPESGRVPGPISTAQAGSGGNRMAGQASTGGNRTGMRA